jgi:hypothetical protein
MMMSLSSSQVTHSLEIFEVKPGHKVRLEVLKDLLPDAGTALFFGKLYKLDYIQLSKLLRSLFHTTVIDALLNEGDEHSHDLQNYIIDIVPDAELQSAGITAGQFTSPVAIGFLPELWEQLDVQIADSITKLVEALDGVLSTIQGKNGKMMFSTLYTLNKQRAGVLGAYKAQIKHPMVPNNLVVFDVSGSVNSGTVTAIVEEVVALAYKANASLAIVSDNTFLWDAGTFDADAVLEKAEYCGTHYETLSTLFDRDWATVITIADYDSAWTARDYLVKNCAGRIEQVLDISLVDRPTFLAECLGPLANAVRPLLVGNSGAVIGSRYHQPNPYSPDDEDEFDWDDEDDEDD